MSRGARTIGLALAALALGAVAVTAAVIAGDQSSPHKRRNSNALWHVVHDLCVTDMKISGSPAPCLAVDRAAGWPALKDMRGATQIHLNVRSVDRGELLKRPQAN